ncbi:MAG: 50S ribosomal protein L25 [Thermoleophilia bacterium]
MERVKLVVRHRDDKGTRSSKRLRKEGLIPGVLYGAGKPATAIAVDDRDLRGATTTDAGLHAVLNVVFDGTKTAHVAIVKDVQLDPVKHHITHIDLQEIKLTDKIETTVTVHVEGVPNGVKMGGMLDVIGHEVTVEGLPTDIPEHLVINVEALEMGDVARVSDLVVPDGVRVLEDAEEVICSVVAQRAGEEEGAEEGVVAGAGEPELVGKGEAGQSAE